LIVCKAAVAWDAGQTLTFEDIEVAPPKAHEVRIEIYYTGVCHTGMRCYAAVKCIYLLTALPQMLTPSLARTLKALSPLFLAMKALAS
jgi:hypothetical protein